MGATQAFLKQWDCRHRLSSAYLPHSNLIAERGGEACKEADQEQH